MGDWDWTEETGPDSCLTFDGWEGFLAVKNEDGDWQVYFDVADDGLKGKVGKRRMLELGLKRRLMGEQEVNQWGLGSSGNLGVKKTVGPDVLIVEGYVACLFTNVASRNILSRAKTRWRKDRGELSFDRRNKTTQLLIADMSSRNREWPI